MSFLFTNPIKQRQYLLILFDCLIVLSIFLIAYVLKVTLYEGAPLSRLGYHMTWFVIIAVVLHIVSFYIFELYNLDIKKSSTNLFFTLTMSVFLAISLIAMVSYVLQEWAMGRIVLLFHSPFLIAGIFLWRKLFFLFFSQKTSYNNVLIIGSHPSKEEVHTILKKYPITNYNLIGAYDYSLERSHIVTLEKKRFDVEIIPYTQDNNIRTLVTAERLKDGSKLLKDLLKLKVKGIKIYDYPTFYEELTGKIPVSHIGENSLIFSNQGRPFNPVAYINIKRVIDILIAALGLMLSAPFFIIIALLIKLTSRGPVLFLQERLGLNEKPFTLLKFRTMVDSAEAKTGPRWASANDPRITKIGKFLRKSRIDELPQLINILKGEMSFVGPRPIRKHFADIFSEKFPFYRLRFTAKPGITGWAQVRGDYAGTEEGQLEKLEYDLFYIQNRSALLDSFIVIKTIQTVLLRRGE